VVLQCITVSSAECSCGLLKGPSAAGAGLNEDGWTDVVLAARLVRALSESTGDRKLSASVVGRNVLAVAA
jgi:hypothetical protein